MLNIGKQIDRVVSLFAPSWALNRAVSRSRYEKLSTFRSAEKSRRYRNWRASPKSADSAIIPDAPVLIARARQMYRDNAYIRSIVRSNVRNVVGRGITPAPAARFKSGRERRPFNESALALFMRWARTPRLCDVEGRRTLFDMQRCAEQEITIAGQILFVIVEADNGPNMPGIQLQMIEVDQLDDGKIRNPDNGNIVRGGVEVDSKNRSVAYWIKPTDTDAFGQMRRGRSVRVIADNVIDLFHAERSGQTRGVSELVASMHRAFELEDYDDAERFAARIAACIGVVIKKNWSGGEGDDPGLAGRNSDDVDEDGNREFNFQPGMVAELDTDEDIDMFNPARPANTYKPFVDTQLHGIAAGADLSYQQVTRDFTGGTFSSQRQSLLEDRRSWGWRQDFLIDRFCCVVWRRWLFVAAMEGAIRVPASFFTEFETYAACDWQPDGWDWIDPLKEAKAAETALKNRLTTRKKLLNEKGESFGEVIRQIADERDQAGELEIVFPEDADTAPEPVEPEPIDDETGDGGDTDGDSGNNGTDDGEAVTNSRGLTHAN